MDKSIAIGLGSTVAFAAIMGVLEVGFLLTLVLTVLWMIVISVVLISIESAIENKKKSDPEFYTKHFYEECVKNGVDNVSTKAKLQKAVLLQEKLGYQKYGDAKQLFSQGQALINRRENQQKRADAEAKAKERREKDMAAYRQSIKYAELIGREKRLAMMRDRLSALQNQAAQSRQSMMMLTSGNLNAMMEKEKSWGLAGGLAEGIAGPAAGVAAALETEAENQRIRERNAQRREHYIQNNTDAIVAAAEADNLLGNKIEKLRKKIEETPLKLVSQTSDEEVFKKIIFGETYFKLSKRKVLKIEVLIKSDLDYIYDDVSAVVDGTLKGVLYQQNRKISEALFVLPEKGVSNEFVTIKGICIDCDIADTDGLEVVYQPYHLWEIEKV